MAVETISSTIITARDSSVSTQVLAEKGGSAPIKEVVQKLVVASAASSASRYVICQVPTSCRPVSLACAFGSLGSVASAQFGVFKCTKDSSGVGATAIQSSFLGNINFAVAAVTLPTVTEVLATSAANCEKVLWDLATQSADPGGTWDLVMSMVAVADVGGTVSVRFRYL